MILFASTLRTNRAISAVIFFDLYSLHNSFFHVMMRRFFFCSSAGAAAALIVVTSSLRARHERDQTKTPVDLRSSKTALECDDDTASSAQMLVTTFVTLARDRCRWRRRRRAVLHSRCNQDRCSALSHNPCAISVRRRAARAVCTTTCSLREAILR